MTQSKSRRLLYQQARLIRIQWAVIMALVCTIVLMAIFLPKAKAIEETAAPTLELEPASYVTPEIMPEPTIETEPEEIEPVLEELGEFRLTAYCACRKCCGKDPGDFGYGVTASCTDKINDFDFDCLHTENHADYTTHLRRIVFHKCAEYK